MTNNQSVTDLAYTYERPVPVSVSELRQINGAFPEEFPDEVGESLLRFASQNNFEISGSRQEVMTLFFQGDSRYLHFITPSALKRKARSTGLWMPGDIQFFGEGFDLIALANSWIRFSHSDQWIKGASVTVPLLEYYDRIQDTSKPKPIWQIIPHSRLAVVAECRAIYEALGDLIADYLVIETWNTLDSDINVNRFLRGEISYAQYVGLRQD